MEKGISGSFTETASPPTKGMFTEGNLLVTPHPLRMRVPNADERTAAEKREKSLICHHLASLKKSDKQNYPRLCSLGGLKGHFHQLTRKFWSVPENICQNFFWTHF